MAVDEAGFEKHISDWLVAHGGYREVKVGNPHEPTPHFDAEVGIDTAELFAFIGETQAEEFEKLVLAHGDLNNAQRQFVARLAKELDAHGTVHVLRRGVQDHGAHIQLAYFRPANSLTPISVERYVANRLTVTRQLPYASGSTKSLDLCLFVNGLPVATAELKNSMTGQTVEQAKTQYRVDRNDPANPLLNRRAVVHFAVDTEQVAMTTRLQGADTRFLPFNRGNDNGAGNPPNPKGHRTAYLWEQVWTRDAWLDLLHRFVHVAKTPKSAGAKAATGRAVIFPRFHQWEAVRSLEAAARVEGPGHDYLVEHSAGSGKSNTIAWLAHRLSSLHDADDRKVFDKVVVITDRRVLDSQLQETIYQFDHVHGVVQKIDESSAQLAEALAGQSARIIITTLQKFPVVLKSGAELPDRTYAVIVDEAHSSQSGESAKDLKLVLSGASPEQELTAAEVEDAGFVAEPVNEAEEALAKAAGARGRQTNLSFFAFTATPKGRTLELFGRKNPDSGKYEPFSLYSMRQAIEEKFILDVLANYITYQTYWNIEKTIEDDPAYASTKAKAAIARFVSLHEHNLSQKAEVIIEHFRQHIAHRVGGKAKAMVVTSSRLHAVRYQQALKAYVNEHGYDIGVLVAFSGTVDDGGPLTEANLNGFPESQTAKELDTDAFQVLVVAEKYQTGFDQPLLCAMYVDKTLTGLATVQTLSRLNRTHPDKRQDDVFVLDFRNDADDIRAAFEPWYGKTVAPPTDPNLLYDTRHALDPFGVLWAEEVEVAVDLLLGPDTASQHARFDSALQPTIDRFWALDEDDQDAFRDAANRFVRMYAFLAQVVTFSDVKLERDYLFVKALSNFIKGDGAGALDLGTAVELSHLRVEETSSGSLSLAVTDGEVSTIFSGTGKISTPAEEPLSQIIDQLNQRFGTSWLPQDMVAFFGTITDKLAERPDMQQAAAANSPENFNLVAESQVQKGVIDQLGQFEDMALTYLDDPQMKQAVLEIFLPLLYGKAKVAHQEHCPIGELLGPDLESSTLEYKATFRTHADGGEVFKPLETSSLKTIAAFANSHEGGTLLIGVADDGSVHGLGSDYASMQKPGKDDRDLFQLHLGNAITASMGAAAAALVTAQIHHVDGHDLCRVHVRPSAVPVDATVTIDTKAGFEKKTELYVRTLNGTRALDETEKAKHIAGRWPS